MEPVLKTLKTQTLVPSNARDAVTFASSDEQYATDGGGQIVVTDMKRFTDALGEAIQEKSILVLCGVTGERVHLHSSHRCIRCRRLCSGSTLKKRASVAYLADDHLNAGPQPAPVLGFCSDCWKKWSVRSHYYRKELVRLLKCAFFFIIRPVRAIAEEQSEFLPPLSMPGPDSHPPAPVLTAVSENAASARIVEEPVRAQAGSPEVKHKKQRQATAIVAMLVAVLGVNASVQCNAANTVDVCRSSLGSGEGRTMTTDEIEPVQELPANTASLLKMTAQALEVANKLGLDSATARAVPRGMCLVLKRMLENGETDPVRLRILLQEIEKRKKEVRECVLLFDSPEPADVADGDLEFMTTYPTGIPVRRPHESLSLGFEVFSNMGQGKSTLLFRLAQSWLKLDLPAIIIELKPGGFFSALSRSFPDRVLWFKADEPVYNAFAPVNGNAIQFIREKLEYWQSCYQRWDSAMILAHLLEQFDNSRHLHHQDVPTLRWFLDVLPGLKLSRELFNPSLKPSVYGTLDLMNKGLLGSMMTSPTIIDWRAVMDRRMTVVLELYGISDADYLFTVGSLLADLREIRQRNPGLPPVLFAIDEADALVSERWDRHPHIGAFASEVPLGRSAGIYVVFAAHNPSKCHPLVRSNSGMALVSAVSGADDIAASGASAAIPPDRHHAITLLPPFVGALKITGAGYPLPFLVTWKPPAGLTPLTEQERIETNSRILFQNPSLTPSAPSVKVSGTAVPQPPSVDDDTIVLRDLHAREYLSVTERLDDLVLSNGRHPDYQTLTGILNSLQRKGFCEPVDVRMVKGRAGTSVYWILTPKGYSALRLPLDPARPGTGVKHTWAQRFIQHILAGRNIAAEIEPKRSQSQPDLGISGEKSIALEVCLSSHASEYSKIRRTLADWNYVLIVCLMPDDRKALQKSILAGYAKDCQAVDSRVTICHPFHLLEPDLATVYGCPNLVYGEVASKTRKSRRSSHV